MRRVILYPAGIAFLGFASWVIQTQRSELVLSGIVAVTLLVLALERLLELERAE
ncbi:hypothetical protein HYW30_01535 [Candidatus Azambacteria bacterium]|nr:hypothetical protein [Candidatus Azambacteria bacterium]MBI2587961.1 hypothetical protein [Candidatus Azambacteria bacterium]